MSRNKQKQEKEKERVDQSTQEEEEGYNNQQNNIKPLFEEGKMNLIKIPPHHFVHVLDTNKNVSRLVNGPLTLLTQENETIVYGPKKMHVIPKSYYCIIENPVIIDKTSGKTELDRYGQAKLKHGQREIRFEQDEPFPLYPGERMLGEMQALRIILDNEAIRLRAVVDFTDDLGNKRMSGQEWLIKGPSTYRPRVEEEFVDKRSVYIIKSHQALKLRAKIDLIDSQKNARKSDEEWLVSEEGAYMLDVYEELVEVINATVLDEKNALMVQASRQFVDGEVERKKGDMWLLTKDDTSLYIPPPEVKIKKQVPLTVLNSKEYCIIQDPVDEDSPVHKNLLGERKLIRGPTQFFLRPGETIEGIECVRVLAPEDAIQVTAIETFQDAINDAQVIKSVTRKAGTRWYVYGPCEYIPPLQVREIRRVKALIQIDDLNIYIFSPIYLFLLIIIPLYIILKSFGLL